MDDPSGDEHDKAVELIMEMMQKVPVCTKNALPDLLRHISDLRQSLEVDTPQDNDVLAVRFLANIISEPSESAVSKNWQVLEVLAPSLIGTRQMDDHVDLLRRCLSKLIDNDPKRSAKICEALMRVDELYRSVPA